MDPFEDITNIRLGFFLSPEELKRLGHNFTSDYDKPTTPLLTQYGFPSNLVEEVRTSLADPQQLLNLDGTRFLNFKEHDLLGSTGLELRYAKRPRVPIVVVDGLSPDCAQRIREYSWKLPIWGYHIVDPSGGRVPSQVYTKLGSLNLETGEAADPRPLDERLQLKFDL